MVGVAAAPLRNVSTMGLEYSNERGEEMFPYSSGVIKRYNILINLITPQNMYDQNIDQVENLVHGMIGTTCCCNNGLDSLGVDIFI